MNKEKIKKIIKGSVPYIPFIALIISGILYTFFCPEDKFNINIWLCYIGASFGAFILYLLPDNKILHIILGVIASLCSSAYTLYFILINNQMKGADEYIFNILMILVAMLVIFLLTQNTKWSVISISTICWLFYLLDAVVLSCRKTPIIPNDIFSISSALTVANQYKFVLTEDVIRSTFSYILLVYIMCRYELKIRPYSFKLCWLPVIPIILAGFGLNYYSKTAFKTVDNFDTAASNKRAGYLNTFYVNAQKMIVKKPKGYSEELAEETIKKYVPENSNTNTDTPNIIVIMDEAFSDLRYIGNFETDVPFMPYIDNMEENTIKGNMAVSVLGGNTCNTEYEFLTGNSLDFLPNGYIPYIRTITGEIPSLCRTLSQKGYETTAVHPYIPNCWRRDTVYPFVGFDKFISGYDFDEDFTEENFKLRGRVDFGDLEYVRKYISDKESFSKVIKTFEEKGDKKEFIFNVTMQNHGPYTYTGDDFVPQVTITEDLGLTNDEKTEAEQYLTLVKYSDQAFGELIEYFKNQEEDTIIVFFGDHMPGLPSSTYNKIHDNGEKKDIPIKQLKYTVPFVIWANFPIPEKKDEFISVNYLSSYLMDIIGMEKDNWDALRDAAHEKYPAINCFGAFDKDRNWIDKEKLSDDVLKDYEIVQYKRMFGKNKS